MITMIKCCNQFPMICACIPVVKGGWWFICSFGEDEHWNVFMGLSCVTTASSSSSSSFLALPEDKLKTLITGLLSLRLAAVYWYWCLSGLLSVATVWVVTLSTPRSLLSHSSHSPTAAAAPPPPPLSGLLWTHTHTRAGTGSIKSWWVGWKCFGLIILWKQGKSAFY